MLSRKEIISKHKEDDELCIIQEKVEKGINTRFEIIEGILFSNMWCNEACRKIMIPRSLIILILEGLHDGCGHQGIERVIRIINLEINWKWKYKDTYMVP